MIQRIPYRFRWWIGITLGAMFLAFGLPFAVGASNLFSAFPAPDDVPAGVEPTKTGSETFIDSGRISDVSWQLTAYESDKGLCANLNYSGIDSSGGGGCGFGLRGEPNSTGDEAVGSSSGTAFNAGEGGTDVSFAYGPTTQEVKRVLITLRNGQVLSLPTNPGPPEMESKFNFYVTAMPGFTNVTTIIGKDAQGVVVDRLDFGDAPPPTDFLKEPPQPTEEHAH